MYYDKELAGKSQETSRPIELARAPTGRRPIATVNTALVHIPASCHTHETT